MQLSPTDSISGLAGSAAAVTYSIFGDAVISSADNFKLLAQGQVPNPVNTLLAATAGQQSIIKEIHLVNTTGSAVTVKLYVDGTVGTNQFASLSIPANGGGTWTDAGWKILDSSGQVISGIASLAGDVAGLITATVIQPNVVDNTKLAQMAQSTIKGRAAGAGTGNATDLTATQAKAVLAIAATDVSGLAPIATSGSATDLSAGTLPAGRFPALTGDVTTSAGALGTTLATVNGSPGTTGDASHSSQITTNAKGLVTANSSVTITPAAIGAPAGSGNSTGTNTGDVTLTAVGSSPSANAASLAGQALTLQPSSATLPGVMTAVQNVKLAGYYDAVADFGFVGDHRSCYEIPGAGTVTVMTAGSNVVTLTTTAPFTSTLVDGGKRITVGMAGTAGAPLVGFIQTVSSATSCTIVTTKGGSTPQNAVLTVIANTAIYVPVQFGTDNTTAITTLQTTINNLTFPAAKVVFPQSATNRYAFPAGITFNKPVTLEGMGGGISTDEGDYTKAGGTCLAWWGTNNGQASFDGFIKILPITGATAQPINAPSLRHLWFDGRNGEQNQALYGTQIYSSVGYDVQDVYWMDCLATGADYGVVEPLGATASASRGHVANHHYRQLEPLLFSQFNATANGTTTISSISPVFTAANVGMVVGGPGVTAGTTVVSQTGSSAVLSASVTTGSGLQFVLSANSTPTTTSTAITLTNTPQNITIAAVNGIAANGYVWIMSTIGTPVLCLYTGGGTTTLSVSCSVADAVYAYATVSGSNVVQAIPGNGAAIKLSGSTTGNANLSEYGVGTVSHGTTWGPAAIDFRNADSEQFSQMVINGGNGTNDGAINRIRKPGYRFSGHATNLGLAARNMHILDGDPGVGGISNMGVNNAGATLTAPSGPNYLTLMQMANGSPAPNIELGSLMQWDANGAAPLGLRNSSTAATLYTAAALTLIPGSNILLPPTGFQIGTLFRWKVPISKTAAGVAGRVLSIRVGTTGTTADAIVQTWAAGTATAAIDAGWMDVTYEITAIGASATGVGIMQLHHAGAATPLTGLDTRSDPIVIGTPSTFNSVVSTFLQISLSLTTGAAAVETTTGTWSFVDRVGKQQ